MNLSSCGIIAALVLQCNWWGAQALKIPEEMKVTGNWGDNNVGSWPHEPFGEEHHRLLFNGKSSNGIHHHRLQEIPKAKSEGVFAYPYEDYKLESNGLRVIIIPLGDDFPGLVSVQIPVIVGSRNELEPGKTGMAHFFEHMMFKGTDNVSFQNLTSTYSGMGGRFNAFTSLDFTNYFITAPATSATGRNNLETIMYVESDRFKNIKYNEDEFKTEAGAILGEYNFRTTVYTALNEAQQNISFSEHTYKHTPIGTLEDIRDMPNEYEYSLLFFDRYYRPENTVVMVFGDIDVNETKALVEEHWGDWERGELYEPEIPQDPPRESPVYEHVEWGGQTQPIVSVGFKAANFTTTGPESAALSVIDAMAFSYTSDLHKKLVFDEGSAISLSSSFFAYKDPSLFTVTATVDSLDSVWPVRDDILKMFAKLRTELVSTQDLNRVTSAYKNAEALSYTSTAAIAQKLAIYVGIAGDPNAINEIFSFYDTLTPEIIRDVANKYFTDDRLSTVTVAYANDTLPNPPSSEFPHELAGSVDVLVKSSVDTDPYPVDKVILKSESSQLVYTDIRFRVGSADDPKGKEGLASLTAQMIDHAGSTALTFEQVSELLFPLAASWRASVGAEYTLFTGEVHADSLAEYYDVVSGLLLSPGFRQEDFDRIKTDALEGLQKSSLDARAVGQRSLMSNLYKDHPFGHAIRGTAASLESITLDDVKDFYATHYTKQKVILGLAGGVSDEFVGRVTMDLQTLPDGPARSELTSPPAPRASNAVVVDQQGAPGTTVFMGYTLPAKPTIPVTHPDYTALEIATAYYGGSGFIGTLVKEIREKRGLNYYDFAEIRSSGRNFYAELGSLDTTEHAHFAARLAMYEINKVIADGMDEESFEGIRTSTLNGLPLSTDTQAKTLSNAISLFELGVEEDYLTAYTNAFGSVTLEQVNEAAKKWLQDTDVTFIFTTPEPEDMRARLAAGVPSMVTYAADDKPEEVLMKDEILKDYPLGLSEENVVVTTPKDVFELVVDEEEHELMDEGDVAVDKTQHVKTATEQMNKVTFQEEVSAGSSGRPSYLRRA